MDTRGIGNLTAGRLQKRYRTSRRRIQKIFSGPQVARDRGFFDAYPRFCSLDTGAPGRLNDPNRLNERHRALIESNQNIIQGRSVLDIASHDGRWSFAAHKAGARLVLGIEAREALVQHAYQNMRAYQVPDDRVQFVVGDVFDKLDGLSVGDFETVFCLGFVYHTMHHVLLLNKIARLRPQHIVLDTVIDLSPDPIIVLRRESVARPTTGAIADLGDPQQALVGTPTKSALDLMLVSAGYIPSYYDWHQAGVRSWDNLGEYEDGTRVSLVAARQS